MSSAAGFSIVVPVFCEADSLPELADRVHATFTAMGETDNIEIIFVDDGSTDNTSQVILELTEQHDFIKGVVLRGNCGKSLALMAGFRMVQGDVVIQMDGDLQDRPEDIPVLLAKLAEGWDVVSGWRHTRQDTLIRKIGSKFYNTTVSRVTGLSLHDHNCGIKAYCREAVNSLCLYGENHRYATVQAHLLGFRVTEAKVGNDARKYGSSKFSTFRYTGLFDLLSIMFTHRYGTSPLHFFGTFSAIFIIPSTLALLYWTVRHLMWLLGFGQELVFLPRPLFNIALTALMLGMLIFVTGFVCDFILHHQIRNRIVDVVNRRVKKTINIGDADRSRPNVNYDSVQEKKPG